MVDYPISTKFGFLKQTLSGAKLESKTILDAGTGPGSAQFLAEMTPKRLICVALQGDLRKGESTKKRLKSIEFDRYELIYGDLSDRTLFAKESFDFILGDYFIGELHDSKIDDVFQNLFVLLRDGGEIVFVDREPYFGFIPKVKYVSMANIKAEPRLGERSNRDLLEVVNIFMGICRMITTLSPPPRAYDLPSPLVSQWLKRTGFRNIDISYFNQQGFLKHELEQGLEWVKERMHSLTNHKLTEGLLLELNKIIQECERRKIGENEYFLRKHYVIRAGK